MNEKAKFTVIVATMIISMILILVLILISVNMKWIFQINDIEIEGCIIGLYCKEYTEIDKMVMCLIFFGFICILMYMIFKNLIINYKNKKERKK